MAAKKAGATGPHGHALGYRPDCAQCRADLRRIRAKKRAKAAAEEIREERRQERMTPQHRAYLAEQRRNQRASRYANVVALPASVAAPEQACVGPNEQAVIDQCAESPKAGERPSIVMQARTLARVLDSPAPASSSVRCSGHLRRGRRGRYGELRVPRMRRVR